MGGFMGVLAMDNVGIELRIIQQDSALIKSDCIGNMSVLTFGYVRVWWYGDFPGKKRTLP